MRECGICPKRKKYKHRWKIKYRKSKAHKNVTLSPINFVRNFYVCKWELGTRETSSTLWNTHRWSVHIWSRRLHPKKLDANVEALPSFVRVPRLVSHRLLCWTWRVLMMSDRCPMFKSPGVCLATKKNPVKWCQIGVQCLNLQEFALRLRKTRQNLSYETVWKLCDRCSPQMPNDSGRIARPVIASNGAPFLQMRLVVSDSTSGRKEGMG